MHYFTWKEAGLTEDCESLDAMAARFEESALLMRDMAKEGFELKRKEKKQIITHRNQNIFLQWGFVNEAPPFRQLALTLDS